MLSFFSLHFVPYVFPNSIILIGNKPGCMDNIAITENEVQRNMHLSEYKKTDGAS